MKNNSNRKRSSNHYECIRKIDERNLPIHRVKKDLLKQLKKYETLIILGETGCGKTTQIPQFILYGNINNNGSIIVTQPRRIAAVSIAQKVAEELNVECGGLVGYKIRFENNSSQHTLITYATDGTLLREAIHDELLMTYSVIILDEAHERTVTSDLLFGIVKAAQETRKIKQLKPLKILIMSAALDVDHFKSYFNNAPVLHIEGRSHKVDLFLTEKNVDDYYFTCLATVFNIHMTAPPQEDILVFMTGQEEILKMARDILMISQNPECTGPPLRIHTLYSSADPRSQQEVFQPAIKGMRKVIISTNIAETSITIPGIQYVIDSGKVKMKFHNPVTGVDILKVVTISQEQALQRTGRAGRESDGKCYRAYSREQFEKMPRSTIPEINRCNLSTIVLTLLAIKRNPYKFHFIDKPDESAIKESLKELLALSAISENDDYKLTDIGEKMATLPLNPKYSKILFAAAELKCLDEILIIIAMLTTDNLFITSSSLNSEINEVRRKFHSSTGDHITLLNVFRAYNSVKPKQDWCKENYLNYRALDFAKQIKTQLVSYCKMFGITMSSSCENDFTCVRKCLITGLFNNIAELQSDKSYLTYVSKQRAIIHPSSVLHKSLPSCIIYTELVESNELYMKNCTVIDTDWLTSFVPDFESKKHMFRVFERRTFTAQ